MKPIVSRADLARVLAAVGAEGLAVAARAHGYELEPPKPPKPKDPEGNPPADSSRTRETDIPAVPLLPTPLWQPRTIVFHDEEEAQVRAAEAARAAEAVEVAGAWRGGEVEAPVGPPLSPWRRLGPLLHRALTVERHGRQVDLPRLVRRLAAGRLVPRLPRVRRRAWVPLEVLVDRPLRLAPFWSDQAAVVKELRRLLGKQAIEARELVNGPDGERSEDTRRRVTPVLALTDLGWYAGDDERGAWLRMARRLQAANRRIVALAPVPRSRWTPALTRAWQVIPWERPAPGAGPEEPNRAARVDRLLVYLAPALQIERGLIRSVRWLLPRAEAHVGVEADVWASRVLGDMFPGYRVIDAGEVAGLRRRFAAEVPAEDQERVIAALRAWHWNRELLPEAWHLEALGLEATLGSPAARVAGISANDVERAEGFMGWLYHDLDAQGDDEETKETLRRWCGFVRQQVPRSLWDPSTRVGEALQKIAFRVGDVEVPDADPRLQEQVARQARPQEPRRVLLGNVADAVFARRGDAAGIGSPLATIVAARPRVTLASAVVREASLDLTRPGARLSAPPRGPIELRTDRSTLSLERLTKPSWARAIGRDRFGLWAELLFEGVPYRMRWIPPGRFFMGSPPDEPKRSVDEGPQHLVTISRGYWLGETPVTQTFWQAVTGTNPSQFKSPDRPVEQVSWRECQDLLIATLNHEKKSEHDEVFRLPTEAEWEYACRAGTSTATYAGPIEILGANNAPVLDAIAWYGGNSGVEYDLDEGSDSSNWQEKQHPHKKAGSRRVGQKLPNQWGLHDMLGNVWEWCSDWFSSSYNSDRGALQRDPVGPATGGLRVLRGGSWVDDAGGVRAACRFAFEPGDRHASLGLRLGRGQEVRQDPGGPVGPRPEGR